MNMKKITALVLTLSLLFTGCKKEVAEKVKEEQQA